MLLLLIVLGWVIPWSTAQIASVPFHDCSTSINPQNKINISAIYAQITNEGHSLNFTLLGQSGNITLNVSNDTDLLSTVFAPTSVLTFILNPDSQSQSAFCNTLRPPSPLQNNVTQFCPLSPGPLAFALGTPLSRSFELMTLNTRVRVVDTSNPPQERLCVQFAATPLRPTPHSIYGHAIIVFWVSVALAIAYWLVVGAGRLAAAWKRGRQRVHNNIWSHVQGVGFVLASAISGERFASSPALMRFGTPSMRDVIFHTQWCTLLGMVTVQWPSFVYPYFAQTAWSTLLYNVSLTQGSDPAPKRWNPLHTDPFNPPSDFADQLADPSSPLFLNTSIPNTLFRFPPGSPATGIPALAAAVGARPQDVFNNAVSIFVLILGGTILLSTLVFAIDWLVGSLLRVTQRGTSGSKTPPWSATANNKEFAGASPEPPGIDEDPGAGNVRFLHRPASRTLSSFPTTSTGWLSHRLGQSSFHRSVLHGNLVRILILFHLPVSIFSCYQFSSGKSQSSLTAVILAALAFAVFSVAIPAWLVFRLTTTRTSKLYDETRTLLSLGPLYNHYAHGSQLFACLFFACNIAYGVALGCGQQSGTAQSIIILVVEVASALTTSVWLPWGRGATMGGISFMLCVARIITAVLLVILSPVVSVGDAAGGWITYAILVIQGLVYLAFLLMLISKFIEGFMRLLWDISFDYSKHTVDTGLLGVIGLASHKKKDARRRNGRPSRPGSRPGSDATTQSMLPPIMQGVASHSRTTVSGPPSVLRPEQLTQPYREDSDDEGGYILGAWHYDDEASAVDPPPASPVVASKTGFSRVAGGRANMESPYTMASANPGAPPLRTSPVPSATAPNLPPGAMAPGYLPHARRKSQSAIIEEAAALLDTRPAGTNGSSAVPGPAATSSDSTFDGGAARKRRNWFNVFPSAASSSGDERAHDRPRWPRWGRSQQNEPDGFPMLPDEPPPLDPSPPAPARSFVVIRDRKPSPLSQSQRPHGEDDPAPSSRFSVARPSTGEQPSSSSSQRQQGTY